MARLTERIGTARRAVASLRELAEKSSLTIVERDAMLQRFEYSVEAVWKAVQLHLREQEGLDVGSPKGVARASLQTGILNEAQSHKALEMIEDRNLTVHTYEEALAQQIAARVPVYARLLSSWIEAVASQPSRD
jgi:nucleotidyltransferase substrate binding protein (TIGR01987 family)